MWQEKAMASTLAADVEPAALLSAEASTLEKPLGPTEEQEFTVARPNDDVMSLQVSP
jgi:hypothetical protein